MISKELLSEVIPIGGNNIELIELVENEITVLYRVGGWSYYNVHELANRCKEWALTNGYKLLDQCNAVVVTDLNDSELHIEDEDFKIPYKISRVFQACEWILENKRKGTE